MKYLIFIIIIFIFCIFLNNKEKFVQYVNNSYIDNPPLVINNKYVTIAYGGKAINSPNYSDFYSLTSDKKLGIVETTNMALNTYSDTNVFVGNSDKITLLQEWMIVSTEPLNLTKPVQLKCKPKEVYLSCSNNGVVFHT